MEQMESLPHDGADTALEQIDSSPKKGRIMGRALRRTRTQQVKLATDPSSPTSSPMKKKTRSATKSTKVRKSKTPSPKKKAADECSKRSIAKAKNINDQFLQSMQRNGPKITGNVILQGGSRMTLQKSVNTGGVPVGTISSQESLLTTGDDNDNSRNLRNNGNGNEIQDATTVHKESSTSNGILHTDRSKNHPEMPENTKGLQNFTGETSEEEDSGTSHLIEVAAVVETRQGNCGTGSTAVPSSVVDSFNEILEIADDDTQETVANLTKNNGTTTAPTIQNKENIPRRSRSLTRSTRPRESRSSSHSSNQSSVREEDISQFEKILVTRHKGDVMKLIHLARSYYLNDPMGKADKERRGKPAEGSPLDTYLGEGRTMSTVGWESARLKDPSTFATEILKAILPIELLALRALKPVAVTANRPGVTLLEPPLLRLFINIFDDYINIQDKCSDGTLRDRFPDGIKVKWRRKSTSVVRDIIQNARKTVENRRKKSITNRLVNEQNQPMTRT